MAPYFSVGRSGLPIALPFSKNVDIYQAELGKLMITIINYSQDYQKIDLSVLQISKFSQGSRPHL